MRDGLGAIDEKGGVLYVAIGNPQAGVGDLRYFDIGAGKESTVAKGVAGYSLSASGEKILARTGPDKFAIVEAKPDQDASKSLDLSKLDAGQLLVEPEPGAAVSATPALAPLVWDAPGTWTTLRSTAWLSQSAGSRRRMVSESEKNGLGSTRTGASGRGTSGFQGAGAAAKGRLYVRPAGARIAAIFH